VLQTYHHILNIVGARMRKYSYAKLFITGCNDFATSEKGDLDLSQRRAERVRDYLMKTWSIDSTRLVLQARNLSDVPTVMGTSNFPKEVHQENRRVELYSDVYEILEPVRTADTVRTVSPPIIRFRPVVQSTQPIASWSVKAGQNKKMLKEFIGAGSPPEILDWEIAQMQENVPRAPVPMYYDLSVTDITGRTYQTTSGTAKVEQITLQKKRRERIGDKVIDRYRLILFDFDKAAITPLQQRIIAYIKTQIKPESVVNIAGYTDYTNPLDYSQKLSRSRADAAAAALGVDAAEVKGVGKAVLLHDNAIPEGRFYCRTVSIIVETPMNAR
jgi:outer membrane protein OmpA-like peptidoglycan-associated protein